jgi:acyl-CoA reductase-like NAD-dependent aldehyde dehydrogenase
MRPLLLDGEWVERDRSITVLDPESGSPITDVATATVDDVERAVEVASATWRRPLSAAQRHDVLAAVGRRLYDQIETSACLIATEGIKTIREARVEARRAAETMLLSAEETKRVHGRTLVLDQYPTGVGRFGAETRSPLGVIVGLTPFNDPLNLVAHKIGPALAAGNAIIVKPDSKTPLSALWLAELLVDAGLPPGWLQVLPGLSSEIGDCLVSHEKVAMVSLTGGVEAGRKVASAAGAKKLAMELGANNAVIVESDADVPVAVERIGSGAFWAAGQNCLHVQRVYAHEDVYEDVTDGLVRYAKGVRLGPKLSDDTDMGPIIDPAAQQRIEAMVADAVDRGAVVATGGAPSGASFEPTILVDVPEGSQILTEEVYGPVTLVAPYRHRDDAIAAANATPYRLMAGVFTSSIAAAFEIASQVMAGGVLINDSTDFRIDSMPFGGSGASGIGREGVGHAVIEMSEPKTIMFVDVARVGLG